MKYVRKFKSEKKQDEAKIKIYKEPWLSCIESLENPKVTYNKTTGIQTNGYDYVDLGLPSGTLWATCNVGAASPAGYGRYYAWGDIASKSKYDYASYRFGSYPYTKYNVEDGLTELELEDDIVHVYMGGGLAYANKRTT